MTLPWDGLALSKGDPAIPTTVLDADRVVADLRDPRAGRRRRAERLLPRRGAGVAGGDEIAAAISSCCAGHLAGRGIGYDHVVATQDFHIDPGAHFSDDPGLRRQLAPALPGRAATGRCCTTRWTPAAIEAVFRKGQYAAAYSGFEGTTSRVTEEGGELVTGLADWLRAHGVTEVHVVGIATDHCVRATALDAAAAGFRTTVLLGLTAGISPATVEPALEQLRGAGVALVGDPLVG